MTDRPAPPSSAWAWLGKLIVTLAVLYAVWWLLVKPKPFDLPAQGSELPAAAQG